MKLAREFAPVDVAIVDCFNVAYRAFSVTPDLTNYDGVPTNAIQGLLGCVRRMIRETKPKSVVVVTESRSSFRKEIHPEYKAGRSLDLNFIAQVPNIHRLCQLMGWHLLEREGFEADDLASAVCRRVTEKGLKAAVNTSDKDIIARCTERIAIYRTKKENAFAIQPADLVEKWDVAPAQIPEVLCLVGDSCDNIPGVPTIGKKTAAKLIKEFGSVAGLYQNLEKLSEKHRKLLIDNCVQVQLAQRLIELHDELDISEDIFEPGKENTNELHDFFISLRMFRAADSLKRELVIPFLHAPLPQPPKEPDQLLFAVA